MKNKKTLIIMIVAFILLIVGASVLYNYLSDKVDMNPLTAHDEQATDTTDTTEQETSAELYSAPDFTVYDIDGNAFRLSDFKGKPVILNFWASWCGPCKSEMPDFDEAYQEYKDDIHFLMINLTDGSRETVEIASTYVNEQGYTFPVYYDTDVDAATTYGVYSIPTTFFIDKDGYLTAHAQGAIDREILQTGIDMIIPLPDSPTH